MQALVYYGKEDVRLEELQKPKAADDELLIKIDACAVCGTDMKTFYNGNPRIKPPRVMGHELTGIVETAGIETDGFELGDRIVMATSISCGECIYCKEGYPNLCLNLSPMGFGYNGGMAEYTVIPSRALKNGHVIKVPKSIKAEHAALAEPLSCAINSNENAGVKEGSTVLVMGAGPLGILNLCVAREFGAKKTLISQTSELRLKKAAEFDCDVIIDVKNENLKERVMEETNGLGVDVVIVTAPSAAAQQEALGLVRKRGSVCLFASLPAGKSEILLDSRLIHYNEITITGCSDSAPRHVEKAVELLGRPGFPADKIVSHVLPLTGFRDALKLMKTGESLRVVLIPDRG